jgi:hypothetical protein
MESEMKVLFIATAFVSAMMLTPAMAEDKPEPSRPAVGQEVSEEYFDWISSKLHFECQQRIKQIVRYDMRTPGIFSGTNSTDSVFFLLRFSRWSKFVADDNTIRMRGDEAEAQNGIGNWLRVNYSCIVNINTNTVVDVSLDDGRLPR